LSDATAERNPDEEPSDRELVGRARAGDQGAFGTLVRRHQQRIFGLGARLLGNGSDADDLVQETFLRAWRALDRFDENRPLAPWLVRIATNRALQVLETRSRRPAEELTETLRWEGPSPDEEVDQARRRVEVMKALNALPDDQRTILVLRAYEGLSYREIADTLEVPIGTVMSRLARAREAMRRRVPS
jgi:RNA polymerase sigma-70 factor (ECF subfamily)